MKIGQLKYLFVVMIAGMLISCSSDAGAEAQQETSDLHYDSPKDFWLSNPSCNEYTNGVKAYVQETKPYTCVRRNNEWMWTKICENNGRTYIDGESWNDGGKCVQQFYKCADGLIVYNGSSGLNPSCGINWSSNAVSSSSIYSSSVGYAGSYGTLIDSRDGQTYKTVTIGTQIWMAENLNYQDSRFSKDTGDVHLLAKHRYTWGEAIDSAGLFSGTQIHCKINSCSYSEGPYKETRCLIPDRVRGVCPEGWHLPTRVEWYEMLFVTTGVKFDDDGKYKTLSYEKTKVLRSTSGWELCPDKSRCDVVDGVVVSTYSSPVTGLPNEVVFRYGELQNKNGTDLYGLSIYPDYYSITWRENRYVATFWIPESYFVSCSGDIDDYQISIIIKGRDHDATLGDYEGLFVRNAISHRGSVRCVKDDASGPSAKSSSSVALPVSSSVKITVPFENTVGSVTDSRDGQTYKTVKIGSQTWMAQNLNYKSENSYCFDDKASKCSKYGRLYTWASAMDSSGVWSTNGKDCGYGKTCTPKYPVQGVCPKGWHVPAIEEWETLLTVVGGLSTAGIVLKSISGWIDFSDNGTDAFSFSALPAGERDYGGNYGGEGLNASFWSSTEPESTGDELNFAYFIGLFNDDDGALLSGYRKYCGVSVRCLKDDASGHLANSSSSLKKYSSSSTVKSSSSVKITSSSSAKITSLSSSREQPKSSSSKVTPSSSSKKVVLSSSSTKQSSSSIDLDYYNRQMQGQKGSGLSWKASDGPFVQINENGVKTDWYYWTDSENGGSSGFNRGSVPNIADEKGSGKYTLKEVESIGGVGGKAVLGPSFMMKDSVFHVGSVESGFSGGSIKLPADKMLGLCLEYTNTFDYFVIQIIYDNDEANNWGRPEFHLPIATEKKIINLPWAVFQKISDWAFADISVYDAIKVMKGVNFQAINNSSKEVFGEFVISKIGAYGTCDD